MNFLEKNLEEILYDAFGCVNSTNYLRNLGLEQFYPLLKFRQLRLGNYGIADLVTISLTERKIRVYELKKDKVDLGALLQAAKYKKAIQRYLWQRNIKGFECFEIEIVLIGRQFDASDWVYLFDGILGGVTILTYEYGLHGLEFSDPCLCNYKLITEGF